MDIGILSHSQLHTESECFNFFFLSVSLFVCVCVCICVKMCNFFKQKSLGPPSLLSCLSHRQAGDNNAAVRYKEAWGNGVGEGAGGEETVQMEGRVESLGQGAVHG